MREVAPIIRIDTRTPLDTNQEPTASRRVVRRRMVVGTVGVLGVMGLLLYPESKHNPDSAKPSRDCTSHIVVPGGSGPIELARSVYPGEDPLTALKEMHSKNPKLSKDLVSGKPFDVCK